MNQPNLHAWKLEIAPQQWIAVGEKSLLEYLGDAQATPVPATPAGCNQLLKWHHRFVPVFDLNSWLTTTIHADENSRLVILLCNDLEADTPNAKKKAQQNGQPVAIRVYSAPERIGINDEQFCEDLQSIPSSLQHYVRSLFKISEQVIAILNLDGLLSSFHKTAIN